MTQIFAFSFLEFGPRAQSRDARQTTRAPDGARVFAQSAELLPIGCKSLQSQWRRNPWNGRLECSWVASSP